MRTVPAHAHLIISFQKMFRRKIIRKKIKPEHRRPNYCHKFNSILVSVDLKNHRQTKGSFVSGQVPDQET